MPDLNNEIILKKIKHGMSQSYPGIQDLSFKLERVIVDDAIRIVVQWSTPSEKISETLEDVFFKFHSSWWQMFKDCYFPGWLKKRYPVKMEYKTKTITVTLHAGYPQLPLAFPEQKNKIKYFTTRDNLDE